MKKAMIVVVALLLGAAGLAAWRWNALDWASDLPERVGGDASPGKDASAGAAHYGGYNVNALGRLTPVGGTLTIGGMVGDRIERLHVHEGAVVKEGDLIAELASGSLRRQEQKIADAQIAEAQDRLKAEAAAADARIRIAELNLRKAKSSQAEITAQEKQVALATSNLELAQRDLARLQGLSAALVSKQELERQRLVVSKAEAELAAAAAGLDRAREASQFAEEGAQAELDAARAAQEQILKSVSVEALQSKAELAEMQVEQTRITAPASGTVLRIFTREGETIASRPLLQMADVSELVCVAEVYEGDLPRVRVGQPAQIASEAFPPGQREVRGSVARIGGLISSPELRSIDPFAPTDRHVVEVEIHFPPNAIPEPARLVNLQVNVTILASGDGNTDENSAGVAQSRP